MNGIHDMGGMHGFGPVVRAEDEPLFHAPWEARVMAIDEIVEGRLRIFNVDAFRYGIERMPPAHYLRASYYERWLATVEYNLLQQGVLAEGEVDRRVELLLRAPAAAEVRLGERARLPASEPPATPAASPARYVAGDRVRVRNIHPAHHTRAPRYTRGKRGVINRVHGAFTFPDTNAHGLGANPQTVYSVRFDARELWGDDAEPNQTVSIDLWENYLEPA